MKTVETTDLHDKPLTAEVPAMAATAVATSATQTYEPLNDSGYSSTRPQVPAKVNEYFLPHNLTLSQAAKHDGRELSPSATSLGMVYRPVLLAQAGVRFLQRKYNLNFEKKETALVVEPDRRGAVRWEEWLGAGIDPHHLDRKPAPEATFSTLETPLSDGSLLHSMEADFVDWIYRTLEVKVRANEELKIYAGPDVSQSEFRTQAAEAARQQRDEELEKVKDSYKTKLERIEGYLTKEERELRSDEDEFRQRKMEEMGTHVENVASLLGLGSKRRVSTSLSKRRMTQKAKMDVEESEDRIKELEKQLKDLEEELRTELQKVQDKWANIADNMTEIPVPPYKKDILVELFGVAWMPYLIVESDGRKFELPGFTSES